MTGFARVLKFALLIGAAASVAMPPAACAASEADSFPERTMRLIVPWPAGGGGDVLGRLVARLLGGALGQTMIVENRAGAGGGIGAGAGANAKPDGYTLLQVNTPIMSINPRVNKNLPYDPLRSFAPVGMVNEQPLIIVTNAALPAKSFRDLADSAKGKPGGISYASSGSGTLAHLAGASILRAANIEATHVPYQGAAPAITALLGGEIGVGFSDVITALPHIQGGRLKALAIASRNRLSLLPDVPTLQEAGGPAISAAVWSGIVVPAGTPSAIVDKLASSLRKVVESAEFKDEMLRMGGTPIASSAQGFGEFILAESERWSKAVREAGLTVD